MTKSLLLYVTKTNYEFQCIGMRLFGILSNLYFGETFLLVKVIYSVLHVLRYSFIVKRMGRIR